VLGHSTGPFCTVAGHQPMPRRTPIGLLLPLGTAAIAAATAAATATAAAAATTAAPPRLHTTALHKTPPPTPPLAGAFLPLFSASLYVILSVRQSTLSPWLLASRSSASHLVAHQTYCR